MIIYHSGTSERFVKRNTPLRAVYIYVVYWECVFFYITFTDTPETIDEHGNNNNVYRKNVPAWKKNNPHPPISNVSRNHLFP